MFENWCAFETHVTHLFLLTEMMYTTQVLTRYWARALTHTHICIMQYHTCIRPTNHCQAKLGKQSQAANHETVNYVVECI